MRVERIELDICMKQTIQIHRNFKLLKSRCEGADLSIWALVDEKSPRIEIKVLLKQDFDYIHQPWIGYFDTFFFNDKTAYHIFIDAKDAICPDLCLVDDIKNLKD